MINLRADAVGRTLLEDAERRSPTADRLQIMLSVLDLLEGNVQRSVARANALVASDPDNEEVKFYRADLAFLVGADDLEAAVEPLMQYGASSSGLLGESVRLRFGYVLGKRGESARAAALVAEAERIAREKVDAGNGTPALRIELAAAAVLRNDPNAAVEWLARARCGLPGLRIPGARSDPGRATGEFAIR